MTAPALFLYSFDPRMHDPLAPLLADGVIDEVVARLKSGKEADLWLVRHAEEIVAAKVYKAREARSFRNNAAYKEGRQVRNTRTQRAMDRGSRFGQAAAEEAWKAKEADALHALHAAGVRVPKPVMFYEGVLLMELVVDSAGHPAPRLIDAHLGRQDAAALYADLRGQVVRMLGCDIIHGDLSAYNVLLGRHGPVVIDFPQVVGAAHNSQAEGFFKRDLENLQRFFAALDPALHASARDAAEIWRAYVRRELTPDFVPTGRTVEPPRPRQPAPREERSPAVARSHGARPQPSAAVAVSRAGGGPRPVSPPGVGGARPQPSGAVAVSRTGGGPRPDSPPGVGGARPSSPPRHGGGSRPSSPARAERGSRPAPPARAEGGPSHPGHGERAHAPPTGPHVPKEHAAPHGASAAGSHGAAAAGAPAPSGDGQRRRRRRRRRRSSGNKLPTP